MQKRTNEQYARIEKERKRSESKMSKKSNDSDCDEYEEEDDTESACFETPKQLRKISDSIVLTLPKNIAYHLDLLSHSL